MNKKEKRQDEIAKLAIKTFGINNQREMIIEECSELIMAIQKLKRAEESKDKKSLESRRDNFIEEMADVVLVIGQFYLSDPEIEKKFDKIYGFKMERLNGRIEEELKRRKNAKSKAQSKNSGKSKAA